MRTAEEKAEVLKLRNDGMSYGAIAKKMNLTKWCVRGICMKRKISHPRKAGRKQSLTKADKLRIKRSISNIKANGGKINSTKLIKECQLNCSRFSMYRHLKTLNMKYKKIKKSIPLTDNDKKKRLLLAKNTLIKNHDWEKTIFSDEKWFSLDGPDGWSSYVYPLEKIHRPKRQKSGGGIMVWCMVIPNGLVAFRVLHRGFNAVNYVDILKEVVVPISVLNLGKEFWYIQDNSRIHTSLITKKCLKDANIQVLEWPPRSCDLNIAENIWKMLDDVIYDRYPFQNINDLLDSIIKGMDFINRNKRDVIRDMFLSYRNRLVHVIQKNGNEI